MTGSCLTAANAGAIFIRAADTDAMAAAGSLCSEIVPVTGTGAIGMSVAEEDAWEDLNASLKRKTPFSTIQEVGERKSQGGRKILRNTTPPEARPHGRKPKNGVFQKEELARVRIRMTGDTVATLEQSELNKMMGHHCNRIGVGLLPAGEGGVNPNSYVLLSDNREGWKGDIVAQVESADVVKEIYARGHLASIATTHGLVSFQIFPHYSLIQGARQLRSEVIIC